MTTMISNTTDTTTSVSDDRAKRTAARLERQAAQAAKHGVPLEQWAAMTRIEQRTLCLQRREARRAEITARRDERTARKLAKQHTRDARQAAATAAPKAPRAPRHDPEERARLKAVRRAERIEARAAKSAETESASPAPASAKPSREERIQLKEARRAARLSKKADVKSDSDKEARRAAKAARRAAKITPATAPAPISEGASTEAVSDAVPFVERSPARPAKPSAEEKAARKEAHRAECLAKKEARRAAKQQQQQAAAGAESAGAKPSKEDRLRAKEERRAARLSKKEARATTAPTTAATTTTEVKAPRPGREERLRIKEARQAERHAAKEARLAERAAVKQARADEKAVEAAKPLPQASVPIIVDVYNILGCDAYLRGMCRNSRKKAAGLMVEKVERFRVLENAGRRTTCALDYGKRNADGDAEWVGGTAVFHCGADAIADDMMVDMVQALVDRGVAPLPMVVTSDRELTQRLRALGATTMKSGVFNRHMDELLARAADAPTSSSASTSTPSDSDAARPATLSASASAI